MMRHRNVPQKMLGCTGEDQQILLQWEEESGREREKERESERKRERERERGRELEREKIEGDR